MRWDERLNDNGCCVLDGGMSGLKRLNYCALSSDAVL